MQENVAQLTQLARANSRTTAFIDWSFMGRGRSKRLVRPCALNASDEPSASYANDNLDLWLYTTFFCDSFVNMNTDPSIGCKPRQYVELGASDGTTASNTKFLESTLGFGGLLIEGHPGKISKLAKSRLPSGRNFIIPEAVCSKAGAVTYAGYASSGAAGVLSDMSTEMMASFGHRFQTNFSVPCRPLSEMLR